jgi:hypothetical protein
MRSRVPGGGGRGGASGPSPAWAQPLGMSNGPVPPPTQQRAMQEQLEKKIREVLGAGAGHADRQSNGLTMHGLNGYAICCDLHIVGPEPCPPPPGEGMGWLDGRRKAAAWAT